MSHAWKIYWSLWALLGFLAFLGPEIYALCTNWRNTLSNFIWTAEKFTPGQPVSHWSAFHFLFMGVFTLTTAWLIGHFGWGLWR